MKIPKNSPSSRALYFKFSIGFKPNNSIEILQKNNPKAFKSFVDIRLFFLFPTLESKMIFERMSS